MGRRWGKTVLGGVLSLATAAGGGRVAWIVPTYKNSRAIWRWSEAACAPLRKAGLAEIHRADQTITFPASGGWFAIFSADNPDAIRGESFHLAIVDEAAKIGEDIWAEVIQPTLADVDGDALLISTPRGRNWFWREYQRALADDARAAAFTAPTSANPNPLIQQAAERAKERIPERSYRQEWLAEFVEDGGGVFRRVREAATAEPQPEPIAGHEYAIGVDWGKHADWTVLALLDITASRLAVLDRFNRIDYTLQTQRLRALADRFRPVTVIAERNSMGEPLIESLGRDGLPVVPFLTTNATKAVAIDALALALERGDLAILPDPILVGELEAFEMQRLPSGLFRYTAPQGMHDDTVMALALAWQAAIRPRAELGPDLWG